MKNFWQQLPKPFLVQAPMENVTDTVFRQIIARVAKPDVFFTEFTSTDGICSQGKDNVGKRLEFTKNETPLIAQIWGSNPKKYYETVLIIRDKGFSGIDINMGCPESTIVANGSCAALIKNHYLAKEIIQATKEAAGKIPISVKTRIGYNSIATEEWISFLLEQDLDAITIHGRTKKEMSKVDAHWDEIGKAVKLRDIMRKQTVIIGNGDIKSYQEAIAQHALYGVDGIMIGRGIFHNLWIFDKNKNLTTISFEEKVIMLIYHIKLFENIWGNKKPYEVMKKYYKIYINGVNNASDTRLRLMNLETPKETIAYLQTLL